MKDAQQLAIIETFVRDYNLRTSIERVPIVREQDGLAKSSRNVNLTEMERAEAPVIQQALKKGALLFNEGVSVDEIEREIAAYITENSSGIMDYVSLLSYPAAYRIRWFVRRGDSCMRCEIRKNKVNR